MTLIKPVSSGLSHECSGSFTKTSFSLPPSPWHTQRKLKGHAECERSGVHDGSITVGRDAGIPVECRAWRVCHSMAMLTGFPCSKSSGSDNGIQPIPVWVLQPEACLWGSLQTAVKYVMGAEREALQKLSPIPTGIALWLSPKYYTLDPHTIQK